VRVGIAGQLAPSGVTSQPVDKTGIVLSVLTIIAILTGPLAALLIQKHIEERRARTDRKVKILRDLMAYRANILLAQFVQAVNGIELEFYGETRVIEAWHTLSEHLYTTQPTDPNENKRWIDQVSEHVNTLLSVMGESLDYHFSAVTLKRSRYYPTGWNTVETENTKLRQAAIKVFEGDKSLKVELTNEAAPAAAKPPITPIKADPTQLPRLRE
jgi:hypothetical protein